MPVWQDESGEHSPWNEKAYQALLSDIESLPPGELRKNALERIKVLDCTNSDPALASCDRNIPPPTQAAAWRKTLEAASVDDKTYTTALAKVLRGLVCSGKDDAIYVVRGLGFQTRLGGCRRRRAKGLIDDLMNKDGKDCPVSPALTDADRAKLLQIKQGIEKAGKSKRRHRERKRSDPGEHRALFCPPDPFAAALLAMTQRPSRRREALRGDPERNARAMGEAPFAGADKNRPLITRSASRRDRSRADCRARSTRACPCGCRT